MVFAVGWSWMGGRTCPFEAHTPDLVAVPSLRISRLSALGLKDAVASRDLAAIRQWSRRVWDWELQLGAGRENYIAR